MATRRQSDQSTSSQPETWVAEVHARLREVFGENLVYRAIATSVQMHPETVRRQMTRAAPTVDLLRRLADEYDLNLHWLLTGEGPMFYADLASFTLRNTPIRALIDEVRERFERVESKAVPFRESNGAHSRRNQHASNGAFPTNGHPHALPSARHGHHYLGFTPNSEQQPSHHLRNGANGRRLDHSRPADRPQTATPPNRPATRPFKRYRAQQQTPDRLPPVTIRNGRRSRSPEA
jgi:hypothetical protein